MIRFSIRRYDSTHSDQAAEVTYEVPEGLMLLEALMQIKSTIDASLTFRAGCRSGVCGTCAVRVNDREVLACSYRVQEGDRVTPLQFHPVIRDLVVDKTQAGATLRTAQTWLHTPRSRALTIDEEKRTERQSDCILCSACYSSCPVLAVNPDFVGPFALTRLYRYTEDPREADPQSAIDAVQTNGVWDCTLCGECTAVCPQGIDPKMDITMLRSTSVQMGHSDPGLAQGGFGTPDFGGGFGFDPNGGF
jgi:fumarate reductase iron-sulfur subunit